MVTGTAVMPKSAFKSPGCAIQIWMEWLFHEKVKPRLALPFIRTVTPALLYQFVTTLDRAVTMG
ncbi:MAG: hypothetical protein Q8N54_14320 [Sulfurimicrobium sp.]|nr:hypothetical protein [Sulfurimicrobium sp.]MDP2963927.1 hypothetical protein [Sulfurimicrobium sp.]MDZ7656925.1 hypothetical protein [Sulfurimicrobium sp.]